jgi:hypothetical protein
MLDWEALVRRRLAGLRLDAAEKEEVHRELAAHLEQTYDRLRGEGLSEKDAFRDTMSQVKDGRRLRVGICFARTKEKPVTLRTKRLWLPSLVTLLVSMVMLPMLESLGLKAQFLFLTGPHDRTYVFTVYTVWLVMLPFVGALGAYLSRRAGGTHSEMIISGIFPALAFFIALLCVLPFMGFLEHGLEANARSDFETLTNDPFGRLGVVTGWVLAPGACLFTGVLVCLLILRQLTPRGIASR